MRSLRNYRYVKHIWYKKKFPYHSSKNNYNLKTTSDTMSTKKKGGVRNATKKSKYKDEHVSDEEEFVQTFSVEEKLKSKDFPRFFIKELTGAEV